MSYTLQLIDAAGAVVFDLHTQAATNPAGLTSYITPGTEFGSPTGSPSLFEPLNMAGGFRTHSRDELVGAVLMLHVAAASGDDLLAGFNALQAALSKHSTIKFVQDGSTQVRYLDYVHAQAQFLGIEGDYDLAVQNRASDVAINLTRQPYLRGALVSVGPVTVNNDPAHATNGRVLEITNAGDAPAQLRTFQVTNSTVPSPVFAALFRPTPSLSASTYVSTTHLYQCEAMTNGTDTSTVADATASGGNIKRTTFATNTAHVSRMQGRPSPTAAWVGVWDVYLRAKVSVSPVDVGLRWGVATGTTHESVVRVSDTSFADYYMGRIVGVEDIAPLLEIFASRPAGSGTLDSDVLSFVPVDQQFSVTQVSVNQRGVTVAADGRVYLTGTGGGLLQVASVSGQTPLVLNPGANVLYMHGQPGLTATATVNYSYYPRYYA